MRRLKPSYRASTAAWPPIRNGDLLRTLWLVGTVATLSWGVAAFGSPYPWAYRPLLVASAALGIAGMWLGPRGRFPRAFVWCAVWAGAAIVVQMVPLPAALVNVVSPNLSAILREQDLAFATAQPGAYPLSIAPARTQLGLTFYVAFAVLLFGTARVLTRRLAIRLAASIAFLGAALSIVSIIQHATFTGKIYGFWELVQGGTPFGPFINKNHFAGWMLMAVPVVMGYALAQLFHGGTSRGDDLRGAALWLATPDGNRAVLASATAMTMSLAVVLTLSRSGIIGLVLALLATSVFVSRLDREAGLRRKAVLASLVLVFLATVLWVGLEPIVTRFSQINMAAVDQRPAIWADAVRITRDFWLTGTGFNTFGMSALHYQTAVPGEHLREAHSDYLQLAAEGGVWLLIPITAAVVTFSMEVRRRFREDSGSIRWIRLGAVTGLLAIAFQSLVDFSLQMPGNAALFAVIAGLAVHRGDRLDEHRRTH